MRRRARTDGNHAEIVEALRARGWRVGSLAALGRGWPDLLITRGRIRYEFGPWVNGSRLQGQIPAQAMLIEIKDGSKPPSAQKLTAAEAKFHEQWPVIVIRSVEDALNL